MYTAEYLKNRIKLVNNYWIAKNPDSGNANWKRGAYMIGNISAYESTKDAKYLDYAIKWADDNDWSFYKEQNKKATAIHADAMLCGDSYLKLLNLCPDKGTDKHIVTQTDALADNPENETLYIWHFRFYRKWALNTAMKSIVKKHTAFLIMHDATGGFMMKKNIFGTEMTVLPPIKSLHRTVKSFSGQEGTDGCSQDSQEAWIQ